MPVRNLSSAVGKITLVFLFIFVGFYGLKGFYGLFKSSSAPNQNSLAGSQRKIDLIVGAGCRDTSNSSGNAALRFLRQNSYSCDLPKVDLDKIPPAMVTLTYHSTLDNINVICRRKIRMGKLGGGGWEICDDLDVRPKPPCIVYSFGINNDFSFDDECARLYGCHVYSFDPSMKAKAHNRSERVHFYDVGLSGSTGYTNEKFPTWKMYTFKDLRKMLGHEHVNIEIVKMDIERSEWLALADMITTGQLDHVNQLLVEYHAPWNIQSHTVLPLLKLLQTIEQLGFKRFYVHKNEHTPRDIPNFPGTRTKCYEVHYLKRN